MSICGEMSSVCARTAGAISCAAAAAGWKAAGASGAHTRAAVTASAALRVVQAVHLYHLGGGDALQDELCNTVAALHCAVRVWAGVGCSGAGTRDAARLGMPAGAESRARARAYFDCPAASPPPHSLPPAACPVSWRTLKVGVAVVEQHDAYLTAVVLVHHAGASVDKVLDGKA